MNKINEPKYYECNYCHRCSTEYCEHCVDFEQVNFIIKDIQSDYEGLDVCPWCYNQLIDIFNEQNEQKTTNKTND